MSITAASKYGDVRAQAQKAGIVSGGKRTVTMKVKLLQKPAWKNIDRLADETAQLHAREASRNAGVQILIPRFSTVFNRGDWIWKGLRKGGWLINYLEREKRTCAQRFRQVARHRSGFQQNNRSDVRLRASIPAKDYFRALRVDKRFWDDKSNLRAYKRDNPEACIYL